VSAALQVLYLFILALPIASVAWTITHEEVVREFLYERKLFYLFTCEYCFHESAVSQEATRVFASSQSDLPVCLRLNFPARVPES
jgi:hypothetical protein